MSSYRVAIIGTGNSVSNHLTAVRALGDRVELVAAVDLQEARVKTVCEENDIPHWYTDANVMLEAEHPDLVCIVTPPTSHKPLAIACLEAGAWVLCEKPLCASLAEFDEITQAEARTGRYVSTVFQWRFGSAAKHLKGLMNANALGRPLVGIINSVLSPRQESHLRLDFQQATVEVSSLYRYSNEHWRFTLPDGSPNPEIVEQWDSLTENTPSSHAVQLREVLDSITLNQRPPVSGDEARRILEFAASLYKSALTGKPVFRGEITPDDPFYHAMNGATVERSE